MMEIKPIVKPESPNERMEKRTQASDEVGNEKHPLLFEGSGDGRRQAINARLYRRPAHNFAEEVSIGLELHNGTSGDSRAQPLTPSVGGLDRGISPFTSAHWSDTSPTYL